MAKLRTMRVFLPTLILLTSGCGAVRAGVQLQDAMTARDAALVRDADQNAPYEWTMASLYLDKAWEEMGTGQYRMCVTLAKKSAEWSDHAIVQVEKGRRTLEVDIESVPEPGVVPDPTREESPGVPPPPPEPAEDASLDSKDDLQIGAPAPQAPGEPAAPAPGPAPSAPVPGSVP